MLDIVQQYQSSFTPIRDGLEYETNDPRDTSLYISNCVFEPVPILADVDGLPQEMPRYFGLFNRSLGELLDMTPFKDSYNLVHHREVFEKQAEQLQASQLGGQRMRVIDRIFEGGKKAHRTIYFPDMTSEVNSRAAQDTVTPRLDVYNSIDKSWSFQVFSGAYRDLCRNTLVFGGEKSYHQKKKHTRNLDTEALTNKAVLSLDLFTNQRDQLNRWTGAGLSLNQFSDILADTICKREEKASDRFDDVERPAVNKGLMDTLCDQYKEETIELGETMFAGYNALTHWSTHTLETKRSKKNQKQHDTQRMRSNLVRDVITSDSWRALEGVTP